jgi:GntR family transcriptional regulator, rspAB operon transcriptional repressor
MDAQDGHFLFGTMSTIDQARTILSSIRFSPMSEPRTASEGVKGREGMKQVDDVLLPRLGVVGGSTFDPVQSPSLADSVLTELRRAVINGKLPPGERLIEAVLAEQLQVSRSTIRQAFLQLRFEGLVEMRPRRGAVVTRMSSRAAREVCAVRGVLEGWASRTACETLTDEQLDSMRDLGRRMGECLTSGNIYEVVELDIAFHSFICQSDVNVRLQEYWQALNALHGALMSSRLAHYNYDPVTVVGLHEELCSVLATRDPEAAEQAVRLHYVGARWEDDEEQ